MAESRSDYRRRGGNIPARCVSCRGDHLRRSPRGRPIGRNAAPSCAAARLLIRCLLLLAGLLPFWAAVLPAENLAPQDFAPGTGESSVQLTREGWRFEPLGPSGADVAQICPLGDHRWALRTSDGQLYRWNPPGPAFGTGYWEHVTLQRSRGPARVRLIGALTGGVLSILAADGSIWLLSPASSAAHSAAGEQANRGTGSPRSPPASAESDLESAPAIASACGPAEGPGAGAPPDLRVPRRIGQIPLEDAMTGVALLPPAETDGSALLLITRRGVVHAIDATGHQSWQADFLIDGMPPAPGPRAGNEPNLALRSVFWSATCSGTRTGAAAHLYALTEWEGLFASEDGGRTYRPLLGGLPKTVAAVASLCDQTPSLLAATADACLRSTDGGRSWIQISASHARRRFDDFAQLLATRDAQGDLLAVTREGDLLRSRDAGSSWHLELPDCPVYVRMVSRSGDEVLAATSRGVLASADGGASWDWRNQGLRRVSVLTMHPPAGDGDALLIGTDLGCYGSDVAGRDWQPRPARHLRPMRRSSMSGGPSAARPNAIFSAVLLERPEVREVLRAPTAAIHTLATLDGRVLISIGGDEGAVLLLPDADPSVPPIGHVLLPGRAVTSLLLTRDGQLWSAGADREGLWSARLSRGDGEWSLRELRGGESPVPTGVSPRLVEVPDESGQGQVWLMAQRLARIDTDPSAAIPTPSGRVPLSLAVAGSEHWLGTDAGAFRSDRDGDWRTAGLTGERVVELVVHPAGAIFARTPDGVHWLRRDGQSWEEVPVPCGLRPLSMAVLPDGRLLLGTADFGVFAVEIPLPTLPVETLLLVEASPNPFKGNVVLRCALPPELFEGPVVPSGATSPSGPMNLPPGLSAPDKDSGASLAESAPAGDAAGASATSASAAWNGAEVASAGELLGLPSLGTVLAGIDDAELCVYTVHGQLVRRLRGAHYVSDPGGRAALQWSWDGRTEQGLPAPSGMYVVATSVGPQQFAGKIIKLR